MKSIGHREKEIGGKKSNFSNVFVKFVWGEIPKNVVGKKHRSQPHSDMALESDLVKLRCIDAVYTVRY